MLNALWTLIGGIFNYRAMELGGSVE